MSRKLDPKPNFVEIEENVLKYWSEKQIFKKLQKRNKGKKKWSFLDGPITANNPMGVHHAWGRTYKDAFQRYKAMRGYDQRYQNGFDCQGLWVEVEVEKELGFKNKKDIESYGIDKFVDKCKERVKKYSKVQTDQSIRLGQWMDWDNSYYTMSDENNYAIWSFLKKCWEKGWLYKGKDVVPWCPRCGTSISQHEILSEEYQVLTHKSIYFKLPIKGKDNTYFLVWTTTPWTLPANVALAVNPDLTYVEIKEGNDTYILAESKKGIVPKGTLQDSFLGTKLEGLEYKGLFDELPAVQKQMGDKKHQVVLWDEVTEEEGTGIVHIAPGCGQEDFVLGKENSLAVIDPTDEESKYPDGFGEFTTQFVGDVAEDIFLNLENKGNLYKLEDYEHRYPTCWRCKSELIFRLVDEWYISMDELRPQLMATAKKMKWIPSFGLERELDWLSNMHDWLISKKRYWGLALPIYECSKCGNVEVIGSKQELKERAIEGWDEFKDKSPHKPWVDQVEIKCSKCDSSVKRVVDVGTPWLDAGIVPFSTMRYFEEPQYWKEWFPAEFICESFPGQFKNWFYALIVMSTVLENEVPAETVFGYSLVRDEEGEEMHKSKGNAIWFDDAVERLGADVMRWMYVKQPIVNNLRFGYKVADEHRRRLLTLYNCAKFVLSSTERTGYKVENKVSDQPNNILDKWILSRLHNLLSEVTSQMDGYDIASALRAIEEFINDFSVWYIRRSRERVGSDVTPDLSEFVETSFYVLHKLVIITSPVTPFFSEYLYPFIRNSEEEESVHLESWPLSEEKFIHPRLEQEMAQVRSLVEEGHSERKKLGIKVRQPLSSVTFASQDGKPKWLDSDEYIKILKQELNVKDVNFSKQDTAVSFDTTLTSELKEEGEARELIRTLQNLRKEKGCVRTEKVLATLPDWPKQYEDEIKEIAGLVELKKGDTPNIERV